MYYFYTCVLTSTNSLTNQKSLCKRQYPSYLYDVCCHFTEQNLIGQSADELKYELSGGIPSCIVQHSTDEFAQGRHWLHDIVNKPNKLNKPANSANLS